MRSQIFVWPSLDWRDQSRQSFFVFGLCCYCSACCWCVCCSLYLVFLLWMRIQPLFRKKKKVLTSLIFFSNSRSVTPSSNVNNIINIKKASFSKNKKIKNRIRILMKKKKPCQIKTKNNKKQILKKLIEFFFLNSKSLLYSCTFLVVKHITQKATQ